MEDTHCMSDLSKVDWVIPMVYDPGKDRGFLYTVGLEKHGRPELFIRDVPRMHAEGVGHALNLIAARKTKPVVTDRNWVEANDFVFKGETHSRKAARVLQKKFLCHAKRNVTILELSPALPTPAGMEDALGVAKDTMWANALVAECLEEARDTWRRLVAAGVDETTTIGRGA